MPTDDELIDLHWPQLGALTRSLEKLTAAPYTVGVGAMGGGGNNITINATTNADAKEIADELAWAMRTTGR